MNTEKMTYADTGVNYAGLDPGKNRSQFAAATTDGNIRRFGFEVLSWSRGESCFLVKTPLGFLGFVIEGLGTKSLVADKYRIAVAKYVIALALGQASCPSFYDKLAQCNVAMAVNDLITLGALPFIYGQYLAVQSDEWCSDQARLDDLINGTVRACNLARCTWGPGETPALNSIIVPDTDDLAGATVGIVKGEPFNPVNIEHGDAIVVIESSGIHANGLTLARKIADKLPEGYLTKLSDGRTYGETLLDPTHIYVGLVEDCLDIGVNIHYAVNITGHGWRKFMRATQPFTYTIHTLPTQLPIFDFLQKHGPLDDLEAYGNLNMGAGFALYMKEKHAWQVIEVAACLGLKAFVAGNIETGDKKVVIKPKGLEYAGETLAVR